MTDRTALSIELQDSEGNAIESDKLEITNQSVITNSVVVETELVPMKDVPLHAENFVAGTPATGYELTAVELAEDSVPVARAAGDSRRNFRTDDGFPAQYRRCDGGRGRLRAPEKTDGH